MADIMTLQEFQSAYRLQNPHDYVEVPKATRTAWGTLIPFFIGLIAVNLLSAAHTGPMLASTFGRIDAFLGVPLGIIGVLGCEFTSFILMLIPFSDSRRENILRGAVIVLAIAVSLIANVNATMNSLQAGDGAGQLAAGIVGVFAPLANIAMAEVLRLFRSRAKQEKELADINYRAALKLYDVQMRTRYANYLKRYGITDATAVMKLSSGEKYEHEVSPQSTTERNMGQERPPKRESASYPPRIIDLAAKLRENGDTNLSYKAIQTKYNVGPSDVSKVKKYLEE